MSENKLKILVFEDDQSLQDLLVNILRLEGHSVQAYNCPTLCPVFEEHETECSQDTPCADVIISDNSMPRMTGMEFFIHQRLRGCKASDKNKAILSGSPFNKRLEEVVDDLGCKVFRKPFKLSGLLNWVHECNDRKILNE